MHERQISKSYDHNAITKIVTSCLIMTDMKIYAPCLDKCEWEKNPMRMIVRLKKGSKNASTRRAHHWSHEEYRAKKKIIILLASEDNTEEQKKNMKCLQFGSCFLWSGSYTLQKRMKRFGPHLQHSCRDFFFSSFFLSSAIHFLHNRRAVAALCAFLILLQHPPQITFQTCLNCFFFSLQLRVLYLLRKSSYTLDTKFIR